MKDYYYIDPQNRRQGPVPGDTLLSKGVTANTYVWCDGMGNQWQHAGDVAELKSLFAPVPPAFPQQTTAAGSFGGQQPGVFPGQQPGAFPGPQPGVFPGQQSSYQQQPTSQPQQPTYAPQQPGYQPAGQDPNYAQKPDNYMVWSILVTLLCCVIGGVVAIVYASKVDSNWNAGRYEEAQKASKNAKNWCIASACVGVFFSLIYVILVAASGSY